MITNKRVAKQISELMIDYSEKLNDSIILVKESCSKDEFEKYRDAVSYIMANMSTRVMYPLYLENPELKPEGFYMPRVDK
jgi:hypothetical protein